jgi:hypothetical protein
MQLQLRIPLTLAYFRESGTDINERPEILPVFRPFALVDWGREVAFPDYLFSGCPRSRF